MPNVGIAQDLPPYVTFETRAEEDRQASIDGGRMVYKNVDYAIITPRGSKDRIERICSEWLAHIELQARQDRFDPRWVAGYKENYKLWKAGEEAPVIGTALKEWPGLSPAQVKNFQNINVRTVEDVAQANEETISRMGFGARDLQQRARAWLEASNSVGKMAEMFSALQTENTRLGTRNDELEAQVVELTQRLAYLELGANPQHAIVDSRASDSRTPDVDFS